MIFEKGKFYRTALGYKAEVYAIHGNVIHGVVYIAYKPCLASWSLYGVSSHGDHLLCEEWSEPHPAEKWGEGTIVEVSDNGKDWYLRRFHAYSKFTKDFVTFEEGPGKDLVRRWKIARLPVNGERNGT